MKLLLFISIISILIISCSNGKKNLSSSEIKAYQNSLIDARKALLRKDADSIQKFIKTKGWSMIETKTGLWYGIYKPGNGESIDIHDIVEIDYTIELLDGTLCYRSDSISPKRFKVGQGGVEAGLEEGILRLHKGDKARFIMPPHLAHGVVGDQNKIPRLAIIKYDVSVIEVYKYDPKD